jgi:hypothetical protein
MWSCEACQPCWVSSRTDCFARTIKPRYDRTTVTELDFADIEQALQVIEERLGEEIARPLRLLFTWSLSVYALLQENKLSINRLRPHGL